MVSAERIRREEQERVFWPPPIVRYQFLGHRENLQVFLYSDWQTFEPVKPYDYQEFLSSIKKRSVPPPLLREGDRRHARGIHQIVSFWPDIERQINPSAICTIDVDSSFAVDEVYLDASRGVNFTSPIADIIAIGRDLRIYLIEVSSHREHKTQQVLRQVQLLSEISGIEKDNITGIVARMKEDLVERMDLTVVKT